MNNLANDPENAGEIQVLVAVTEMTEKEFAKRGLEPLSLREKLILSTALAFALKIRPKSYGGVFG